MSSELYDLAKSYQMPNARGANTLKSVLLHLCYYANKKNDGVYRCCPSLDLLSHELALTKATLSRAVNQLKDSGVLDIERDARRTNVYVINEIAIKKGVIRKR